MAYRFVGLCSFLCCRIWFCILLGGQYLPFRYDDLDVAKSAIRDLLGSYPEILPDPAPLVEVGSYNDSSITIYVRPWVAPSDYWPVAWRFNSDILKALQSRGIDMPYNQLDVHIVKD